MKTGSYNIKKGGGYNAADDYSKYGEVFNESLKTGLNWWQQLSQGSGGGQGQISPTYTPPPAPTPSKKSNTGLIVGISLGVLALATVGIIIYKTRK